MGRVWDTKQRVLCLYVPHFRVVAETRLRPDLCKPVILYRGNWRPVVLETCALAETKGVHKGMLLSRASSLCPQATVLPENRKLHRAANDALVQPMLRLTWQVESTDLGLAFMAVRGVERIGGSEKAVGQLILEAAQQAGYPGRVAVATGPFVAEAAAKHREEQLTVLAEGDEKAFLAPMPLRVLPNVSAEWREMKRRLFLLGLRTLEDIRRLGKPAMQAQFGSIGLQAWRMSAGHSRPLRPMSISPTFEVKRSFERPLENWQQVELAVEELAAELSAHLIREYRLCAALGVFWRVEDLAEERRRVALKEPSASRHAILSAACRHLESDIEGPIAGLGLQAKTVVPETGKQLSLFAGRSTTAKVRNLASELERRFGKPVLLQPQYLGPNLLEERTYTLQPFGPNPEL